MSDFEMKNQFARGWDNLPGLHGSVSPELYWGISASFGYTYCNKNVSNLI